MCCRLLQIEVHVSHTVVVALTLQPHTFLLDFQNIIMFMCYVYVQIIKFSCRTLVVGWRDRLSSRSNSLLGKRLHSRTPQPEAGGHRLGSTPTTNGSQGDDFPYFDAEPPPRKKAHFTPGPSSNASPPRSHGAVRRSSSDRSPRPGTSNQNTEEIQVSDESEEEVMVVSGDLEGKQSPVETETLEEPTLSPQPSTPPPPQTGLRTPRATTPAMDIPSSPRSSSLSGTPPNATGSPGQPSPASRRRSLPHRESPSARDAASASASAAQVLCHYCPGQDQRPAVKTCLQCGASMCSEHLRAHLESPVFQGHPLVPAVEDVSPWRCQEHQEMNRIYCRPCRTCVCTVCTVIGSHRDHACISIKEAEKELRVSEQRRRSFIYFYFIYLPRRWLNDKSG